MPFPATTQTQTPTSPSNSTDGSVPSRRKSVSSQGGARNRLRKRQAGGAAGATGLTGVDLGAGGGGAKTTRRGGAAARRASAGPTSAPTTTRPATSVSVAAKAETKAKAKDSARSRAWTYLSGGEDTMRRSSERAHLSMFAAKGDASTSDGGNLDQRPGTAAERSLPEDHGGMSSATVPRIVVHDEVNGNGRLQRGGSLLVPGLADGVEGSSRLEDEESQRITTAIPTGGLDDLYDESKLQFSKRGSLLVGDQKVRCSLGAFTQQQEQQEQQQQRKQNSQAHTAGISRETMSQQGGTGGGKTSTGSAKRVLSEEEIKLSRKIRAMYEYGDETAGSLAVEAMDPNADASSEAAVTEDGLDTGSSRPSSPLDKRKSRQMASLEAFSRPTSATTDRRCSMITKAPSELAGGIEDWSEVNAKNVDRYGFIAMPPPNLPNASIDDNTSMDMPRTHRVSTASQMASGTQRQKPSIRLALSSGAKRKKAEDPSRTRRPSDARSYTSRKAPASIRSFQSDSTAFTAGLAHSHLWQATNHLLHGRRKRVLDEAGDMLTLPVGYRGSVSAGGGAGDEISAEDGRTRTRSEQEARIRERRREEKWRKMAHLIPRSGGKGGGMQFEFDTYDPKLVNRAWKGIPDRWRASAWYCFLAESARTRSDCESHAELVERYNELQDEDGADDSQIDVDVPRTISSHIMFRRRYRGG